MFEKYCFRSFLTSLANIPPCQDSKWKYDIARSWSKEYTVHPRPTLLKQFDHLEIELLWHFLSEQGLYLGACKVNAVFNISLPGPNFIWLLPPPPPLLSQTEELGREYCSIMEWTSNLIFSSHQEILSITDFHSKSLDHNFMQFFLFNFDKRADMWLQIGICLVSFPNQTPQIPFLRKHLVSR